jgi:hypothetical protein
MLLLQSTSLHAYAKKFAGFAIISWGAASN